jgi:hypothetical protein
MLLIIGVLQWVFRLTVRFVTLGGGEMGEFDLWSVIYREWEACCAGSVHPPLPMPRWAASLPFVIPPEAKRKAEAILPRYIRCARKWNSRSLGFARDDKGEGGDFY